MFVAIFACFLNLFDLQLSSDGVSQQKPQFSCCLIQVLVWICIVRLVLLMQWRAQHVVLLGLQLNFMLQSAEGAQRVRYIAVAQLEMWRMGHDEPMPLDYSRLASVCYLDYIRHGVHQVPTVPICSNVSFDPLYTFVYRMHRPNYLVSWCSFLAHLLGIRYPTR